MRTIDIYIFALLPIIFSNLFAQPEGEHLFNTGYDYLYNNSPNRYIEMIDLNNDFPPSMVDGFH